MKISIVELSKFVSENGVPNYEIDLPSDFISMFGFMSLSKITGLAIGELQEKLKQPEKIEKRGRKPGSKNKPKNEKLSDSEIVEEAPMVELSDDDIGSIIEEGIESLGDLGDGVTESIESGEILV